MKKTLVAAIIGLAATVSVMAQGRINLDTYSTDPFPTITGAGGFTVGIYWADGVVAVANDPTGIADPTTLGALVLGTGPGSTATCDGSGYVISPGNDFTMTPVGPTATFVVVAYNGSSYANSTIRGHSAGFQMNPATFGTAPGIGASMPTFGVFSVSVVPEPSTFALAGLGLAGLLIFRRRK